MIPINLVPSKYLNYPLSPFDHIVILTVDKRINQAYKLVKQVEELGGEPHLWICGNGNILPQEVYHYIDSNEPVSSQYHFEPNFWRNPKNYDVFKCQKQIFKWALDNNKNRMLFLEDDAIFLPGSREILGTVNYQFDVLGINWDFLLLGGYTKSDCLEKVGNPISRIIGKYLGFHAVGLNKTILPRILEFEPRMQIDSMCSQYLYRNYLTYTTNPGITIQSAGMSLLDGYNKQHPIYFIP